VTIILETVLLYERNQHIKEYYNTRPNTLKYNQLLTTTSKPKLINLGKFINIVFNTNKME